MKNFLLCVAFLASTAIIQAQSTEKDLIKKSEEAVKVISDTTANGWSKKGTITFLFNQSTFNNWLAGGESSLAGTLGFNYEFHYKNDNTTWDNRILANYGLLQTKNADFEKKTDDRFEYNSIYGKKAFGNWYYSLILNFRTQLHESTKYSLFQTNFFVIDETIDTYGSPIRICQKYSQVFRENFSFPKNNVASINN